MRILDHLCRHVRLDWAFEHSIFLIITQTLVLTVWRPLHCATLGEFYDLAWQFLEEYGRANFGVQHPTYYIPQQSLQFCDRCERELTVLECWFAFAFVFIKCRGKQESPPSFILSNKERTKAQKKFLFEIFLGFGR